jgi:hypothetical protein
VVQVADSRMLGGEPVETGEDLRHPFGDLAAWAGELVGDPHSVALAG